MYQLRLILEPCTGCVPLCQIATLKDGGDGGTAKGTLRELSDVCLGLHNGDCQIGYSCVMKQEVLQIRKEESPSEQMANLKLCKHSWVDDFSAERPLNNAVLRSLSGGNSLTAARKHGREVTFKFRGQFFLACNGLWKTEEKFIGADERRAAGLHFEIRFVDDPKGPNEAEKDSQLKGRLQDMYPEWWYLVQALWLIGSPRPKSEYTEPKPPNTLQLVRELANKENDDVAMSEDHLEQFATDSLVVYQNSFEKPATQAQINSAYQVWLRSKGVFVTSDASRKELESYYKKKTGFVVPAFKGEKSRIRTTVNAYLDSNGRAMTFKAPPFVGFVQSTHPGSGCFLGGTASPSGLGGPCVRRVTPQPKTTNQHIPRPRQSRMGTDPGDCGRRGPTFPLKHPPNEFPTR